MRLLIVAIFCLAVAANAAFGQNAIVTENQSPGTPASEWDLGGPGSTTLQGFTTDISVNHGSTVNFKIQSGTANWRIDIYRLGYYQGNGARLITTISKTSKQTQPAPVTNSATGEVDAGNWAVTASWAVPASAVSGVYIAHLVDQTNTNNENHIPFIVRADESTSGILFQTSDTTWHAYNGWGGASLYGGNGPGGIRLRVARTRLAIIDRLAPAMELDYTPGLRTLSLALNLPRYFGWNRMAMTYPTSQGSILRASLPCSVSTRSSRPRDMTSIGTRQRGEMSSRLAQRALILSS
jgi:hypothetical protein